MTRLTTDRLTLRQPAPHDLDGYMAFFTSDRARYAEGPLTPAQAWRAFAAEIGHWSLNGYGMFAVTYTSDPQTALGLVGPWRPFGWPEPEIGWLIWPQAEGQGVAFEAARRVVAHVFDDLGWTSAVSYIHPENTRSIALAERLGATRDDQATPAHQGDLVFRHPTPNARAETVHFDREISKSVQEIAP